MHSESFFYFANCCCLSHTTEGDIRLVGGANNSEGRVEVYHRGDGALCVMTAGALMMPTWCAISSVTAKPHVHMEVPTLVEEMVPSTMTTWPALGVRRH